MDVPRLSPPPLPPVSEERAWGRGYSECTHQLKALNISPLSLTNASKPMMQPLFPKVVGALATPRVNSKGYGGDHHTTICDSHSELQSFRTTVNDSWHCYQFFSDKTVNGAALAGLEHKAQLDKNHTHLRTKGKGTCMCVFS